MASLPNVLEKLSGLVTEAHWHRWTAADLGQYLDAAFECFGADRLMIGSDWPVCTLSATYRATTGVSSSVNTGPSVGVRSARPCSPKTGATIFKSAMTE